MSDAPMNHIDDLAAEYLLGLCTDDERAQVEAHAAACPQCAALIGEWKEGLQAAGTGSLPPGYFASLSANVRRRIERPVRSRHPSDSLVGRLVLPLAALALGVFLLVTVSPDAPLPDHDPLALAADRTTAEELAEGLAEAMEPAEYAVPMPESVQEALLTDEVQSRLVTRALAQGGHIPEAVFVADDLPVILAGLDETEVTVLIQRLAERSAL